MTTRRPRLGVNIDHVATLRQQRKTPYPSVVEAARICEAAGAHGITMHLREDRRHIQDRDLLEVQRAIRIPFNLEMAVSPDILRIALDVRPSDACLVPERRRELTTEGGLDVAGQPGEVGRAARALADAGVTVSLFVDPEPRQLDAAAAAGAPCVELHTGAFCDAAGARRRRELDRLIRGARHAHGLGLAVNAGHGINLENIGDIMRVPHLDTLNIGHSIVCRAVFVGLRAAVREMLAAMRGHRGPSA